MINRPTPQPLRADFNSAARTKSWANALAALGVGALTRRNPEEIVRHFGDDPLANMVVKAAVDPATMATFLQATRLHLLGAIAPGAAATRLFANSMQLNLTDIYAAKVVRGSTVPVPLFPAEGAPFPIGQGVFDAAQVGPVKKMMIGAVVTGELEFCAIETASAILQRVLTEQVGKSLDAVVFDTTAGDSTRDAGLLHDVTPITASTGTGQTAMVEDVGALAGALGTAGCDSNRAMYFAAPRQATSLKLMAGPKFTNDIVACNALTAGTVVCVDPAAIGTGYSGAPEVETSREAVLHMEDTTPLPLTQEGTPNTIAAPIVSTFQSDLVAVRLRNRLCWAPLVPGCVQVVNSVKW